MPCCPTCTTTDPNNFYPTQATRYCRPCFRAKYFDAGRTRNLTAKLEREACVDCGLRVTEENACVFDWDHREQKCYNVSKMLTMTNEKFYKEISNCDLVCSNDHRLRTRSRGYSGGRPRKIICVEEAGRFTPL